jgi:hypothetical protein
MVKKIIAALIATCVLGSPASAVTHEQCQIASQLAGEFHKEWKFEGDPREMLHVVRRTRGWMSEDFALELILLAREVDDFHRNRSIGTACLILV